MGGLVVGLGVELVGGCVEVGWGEVGEVGWGGEVVGVGYVGEGEVGGVGDVGGDGVDGLRG